MSKSKKKSKKLNNPDPRLAADFPTANSAEFVPTLNPNLLDIAAIDSTEVYDFIPEIKGNKFS